MQLRKPDFVTLYTEQESFEGTQWNDISVDFALGDSLCIRVTADQSPLRYIRLRWNEAIRKDVRIWGDEWERGYGAMEWRSIAPQRCMPWCCALSNGSDQNPDVQGRLTECFGVKVRASALCFWQVDAAGLTLWLDVRNGGSGVLLGGRTLNACEVVFGEYADVSAFAALRAFYGVLCTDALTTDHKVYGSNNWYYAYGKSSHKEILSDTKLVAGLCEGLANRPYMVIDDGWQPNACDGPWHKGNRRFPDMKKLADEMKALGVRPGIWIRYLNDTKRKTEGIDPEWRMTRDRKYLDPSHPAVLEKIRRDTQRITHEWGYQLIKHDFTTFDIFGYWGFECPTTLTNDGWHFYDRSLTSAEIVVNLYRTIYEATEGKAVIIGCNVIGHLTAGLAHLNRTGDDTSGREWERTRKMGVNTLAFHMMHDKNFFAADADCVGITEKVDWTLNREWLRALSRSGSPLFVSCKPGVLNDSQLDELREAFAYNSVQTDELVPLDWMENLCPEEWLLNGERVHFHWYPKGGAESFVP